jgi:hypothetical protein
MWRYPLKAKRVQVKKLQIIQPFALLFSRSRISFPGLK